MDYLLDPPTNFHAPRPGVAIAILVIHFSLLFSVASTYFRILHTVLANPGFVPRPRRYPKEKRKRQDTLWRTEAGPSATDEAQEKPGEFGTGRNRIEDLARTSPYQNGIIEGGPNSDGGHTGLENFYEKDVFVCEGDGRPRWCSTCQIFKPDRAHHCREVDRCVYKMDHFCPW